jgi:hypothetical protein
VRFFCEICSLTLPCHLYVFNVFVAFSLAKFNITLALLVLPDWFWNPKFRDILTASRV